jgi:hypothetical protein
MFNQAGNLLFWGLGLALESMRLFHKMGGFTPQLSGMLSKAPGPVQTTKLTDFRFLKSFKLPSNVPPRLGKLAPKSMCWIHVVNNRWLRLCTKLQKTSPLATRLKHRSLALILISGSTLTLRLGLRLRHLKHLRDPLSINFHGREASVEIRFVYCELILVLKHCLQ